MKKPVIELTHTVLKSEWDALLARVADLERHRHQYQEPGGWGGNMVHTTAPVGFGSKPGSAQNG